MRVFISGNSTHTREQFQKCVDNIEREGNVAVNPYEINEVLQNKLLRDPTWDEGVMVCLHHLSKCKAMIVLPDWQTSNTAYIYQLFATKLKIKIHYLN